MSSETAITRIATSDAPTPFGHYVQATAFKDLVFVSGQLAASSDGVSNESASFEVQARQVLENVEAIIKSSNSSLNRILKVTAYIVGVENWLTFDSIFSETFGDVKPARAVVPVPALHHGYLIEIDAVAVRS